MRIFKNYLFICTTICACSVLFTIPAHGAVVDPRDRVIPFLHFENLDIRDILKALFQDTDIPYRVDANVMGPVTIKLRDQPFETVLRNVLNQVGATYRIREGAYEILMPALARSAPGQPTEGLPQGPAQGSLTRRIDLKAADPVILLRLLAVSILAEIPRDTEFQAVPLGQITITSFASSTPGGGSALSKGLSGMGGG